jgi:hypothetical protein
VAEERARADAERERTDSERARASEELAALATTEAARREQAVTAARLEAETALREAEQAHSAQLAAVLEELESVRVAAAQMSARAAAEAEPAVAPPPGAPVAAKAPTPSRRAASAAAGGEPGSGLRWSASAQRRLAGALADAESLRAGLAGAAAVLGREGGWGLVATWLPDARGVLRPSACWTADPLAEHGRRTLGLAAPVQSSSLGTALYARAPVWLTEAPPARPEAEEADVLEEAFAAGAGTVLLLPIRHGVARIGLLEMLAEEASAPDDALIAWLEAVGLQLGQFTAFMRAQR